MMRLVLATLCLTAVAGMAETNEIRKLPPPDPNPPTFTIAGEIRAFTVLGQRQITVPCREWFTLEQVIKDLGGFTDFATDIVVAYADGTKKRYSISREFRTDESIRKMKVTSGMIIRVTPRVD